MIELIVEDTHAEELYGYLFHYNYHKQLWAAIPRERINDYFNGNGQGIVTNTSFMGLITKVLRRNDISGNE